MPTDYASASDVMRELPGGLQSTLGLADGAWQSLLSDAITAESRRLDGYADGDLPADDPIVTEACIRLVRARLNLVAEDGLSSAQNPAGRQESYRPPAEIRAEVKQSLDDAGYADAGDSWSISN